MDFGVPPHGHAAFTESSGESRTTARPPTRGKHANTTRVCSTETSAEHARRNNDGAEPGDHGCCMCLYECVRGNGIYADAALQKPRKHAQERHNNARCRL